MDINTIMTNGAFTHTIRIRTQQITESGKSWIEHFGVFNNLSVSVTILLLTDKSKFSFPCNRVLRVNGAMRPIAFWSVTLDLLYRGYSLLESSEIYTHITLSAVNTFAMHGYSQRLITTAKYKLLLLTVDSLILDQIFTTLTIILY